MTETEWPELAGKTIPYADQMWRLAGTVEVQGTGEALAVRATRDNDVRGDDVDLIFGIEDPSASLNPGDLGEHFDRLEQKGTNWYLVVKKDPTVYRYKLHRIER